MGTSRARFPDCKDHANDREQIEGEKHVGRDHEGQGGWSGGLLRGRKETCTQCVRVYRNMNGLSSI